MSIFANIPRRPSRQASHQGKISSIAGELYAEAINKTRVHVRGRVPQLRPSSFPLCSILVWRKFVRGASLGRFEETESFGSHFFTKVGTIAHENIQYWMGMNGKMYGHWRCINPTCEEYPKTLTLHDKRGNVIREGKNTVENTTNNICPCCGEPMEYIELEIVYRGIKGHVDGVIVMPNGKVWIIDYKTTTKTKLDSNKLPERSHLKQLPAYCYILKKRYKMDVAGFSLLYKTRDNPYKFYDYAEPWTKKWDLKAKALLRGEAKRYKAALGDFIAKDIDSIIATKPCDSIDYYKNDMSPYAECPLAASGSCFNKKELRRELRQWLKEHPYKTKHAKALVRHAFPKFKT